MDKGGDGEAAATEMAQDRAARDEVVATRNAPWSVNAIPLRTPSDELSHPSLEHPGQRTGPPAVRRPCSRALASSRRQGTRAGRYAQPRKPP